MNNFIKSHGLGNEYIVFDSKKISFKLSESNIQKICNIHYGIGSDGILLKVTSSKADFGLKIFNPDGSEAEKSGNGLRIFCKYLYDYKHTQQKRFSIETLGGIVFADILETKNSRATLIRIEMGKADFKCKTIPVDFDKEECIDEELLVKDVKYKINCVSVGNPHCVIIKDELDIDEIKQFGSVIENHKRFPNRINVQMVKPVSGNEAEVLIWERGAGFTNASGSSSCAVASVLKKRRLIKDHVTIKMPGGELKIEIDEYWKITMTGEIREIAQGILSEELLYEMK